MGIIVSYSIISDENIFNEVERKMNIKTSIEEVINHFSNDIESFTSFVKTWDSLYLLLYELSLNKIFLKLRENDQSAETNEYTKIFSQEEVRELFQELQNINYEVLTIALNNENLKQRISEQNGYNMDHIFDIECVLIEYNELKNAVSKAYILNSKLIQILFP
ncbi:DUF1877 family protein [Chryseobacterium terrae]|uniref:DUF1877 family protein n=1 Tax=Chryseobacterium terrae TaxID=3163299 RepID=A0ABW8Y3N4_9FLAO